MRGRVYDLPAAWHSTCAGAGAFLALPPPAAAAASDSPCPRFRAGRGAWGLPLPPFSLLSEEASGGFSMALRQAQSNLADKDQLHRAAVAEVVIDEEQLHVDTLILDAPLLSSPAGDHVWIIIRQPC